MGIMINKTILRKGLEKLPSEKGMAYLYHGRRVNDLSMC